MGTHKSWAKKCTMSSHCLRLSLGKIQSLFLIVLWVIFNLVKRLSWLYNSIVTGSSENGRALRHVGGANPYLYLFFIMC
jgi:hypothetical protein